jgi:hypothetical protein
MNVLLYIATVSLLLTAEKPIHKTRPKPAIAYDSSYNHIMHWIDTVDFEPYFKQRERDRYLNRPVPGSDLQPTHYFSPWKRHKTKA